MSMQIPQAKIPEEILKDSVLAHIAAAYFAVAKRLERKTKCSATRGFILSTLRNGATPNKNQIAKQLGFDRTVVHRAIQSLIKDKLVYETQAESGRALLVHLSPKGEKYRENLIRARRAADEKLRQALSAADRAALIRLLDQIAGLEL
jgi:DNA-binding MarR family transcriptional regulator